jgi:hypothetical protein
MSVSLSLTVAKQLGGAPSVIEAIGADYYASASTRPSTKPASSGGGVAMKPKSGGFRVTGN